MAAAEPWKRPIRVKSAVLYDGEFVWYCRACGDPDAFGYAPNATKANDAGLAHVKVCPVIRAGLDRLLASVMAVPEFRTITVSAIEGDLHDITYCAECGEIVNDQGVHVDQHLTAAGVVQ